MRNAQARRIDARKLSILLMVCLSMVAGGALADGVMPLMPAPPTSLVYWQLTDIALEPEVTERNGYQVEYETFGLSPDLSDALMAESLQDAPEAARAVVELTIAKGGQAMQHKYQWNPLPVYLEPGVEYPVEITGVALSESGSLNSLFSINRQGKSMARISAGGYTGHAASAAFTVSTTSDLYADGSLVFSYVLRDVHDLFRLRITYTYQMHDGVRPTPTPIPGFVAVEAEAGAVPSYYVPVPGHEGLWNIITAPEEYRAYGSMSGSQPMFFPADAQGVVVMDETPADVQRDFDEYVAGFVPTLPETLPAHYIAAADGLYTITTRDGETVPRAYGRIDGGEPAFYALNPEGGVDEDAQPVDPAEDFEAYVKGFGPAEPADAPPYYYERVRDNVYAVTDRNGQTHYRAYGRLDGAEPAYYPADEAGTPADGESAVTPQMDFDSYVKGFDPLAAQNKPTYYDQVEGALYKVDDREGRPLYRVYGVLDGQAPAYYPADETGNRLEDQPAVAPEADFDAYVAGFEPATPADVPTFYEETDTEGLWSFKDNAGKQNYRAYGSLNRGAPAFFPADDQGAVARDALPVNPASDLATLPPPVFTKMTPDTAPAYYAKVPARESLYTFTDRDGGALYRVYGAYGRGLPQYYPADAEGTPVLNADAVAPELDYEAYFVGFDPMEPQEDVPAFYEETQAPGVWTFEDAAGRRHYRVYGSQNREEPAFYPSDENGAVVRDAAPAGLQADERLLPEPVFTAMVPDAVPDHYKAVEGRTGIYYTYLGEDEAPQYRVYGAYDNKQPAFYPATEDGIPLAGEAAIEDPARDKVDYSEGFEAAEPRTVPSYYTADAERKGAYSFIDTHGKTRHRVYGSMGGGEAAFYPADESGNPLSQASVIPEEEVRILPTPYAGSVITAKPEAAAQAPLARTMQSPADARTSEPDPTDYTATITGTGQPGQTDAAIARTITADPSAENGSGASAETSGDAPGTATDAPQTIQTDAPQDEQEEKNGTPGGSSWWIALAAAGAALVGGGGYAIVRKGKKK